MSDDERVLTPEVAVFGDRVKEVLPRTVGTDLVGVYFVGSVALGGYVPGESDIDIAAVSSAALTDPQRRSVASAVVEASAECPARGLEFTLYRRDIAGSLPAGAGFEVWHRAHEKATPPPAVDALLAPAAARLHEAAET